MRRLRDAKASPDTKRLPTRALMRRFRPFLLKKLGPQQFRSVRRRACLRLRIEKVAAPYPLPLASQTQMDASAPLRLWHLTSLDAPTVAVVWCVAFAWTARVALPVWLPVVLALAAWSFYIADRLLDARRWLRKGSPSLLRTGVASPLRPRHYFHWKHRRIFLPIAIAAALAGLVLVLHSMPLAARERNSVLAAAALAYFTSVHSPRRLRVRFPKELLVGILFTLACTTPVWTRMSAQRGALTVPILVYMALAWLNCLAIEAWESGARARASIFRWTLTLSCIALAAAAICVSLQQDRPALLLCAAALSAALLAVLDRVQRSLAPTTLRAVADLVLLTPLALLLLP